MVWVRSREMGISDQRRQRVTLKMTGWTRRVLVGWVL